MQDFTLKIPNFKVKIPKISACGGPKFSAAFGGRILSHLTFFMFNVESNIVSEITPPYLHGARGETNFDHHT